MSETNIQQLLNSVFTKVDEDLQEFKPLKEFASNKKIRPSYIFLGVVVFLLLLSLISQGLSHSLITLFAMIYPSYMSFKAIYKDYEQMRKKWLTYWLIFGFVTIFDKLLSTLLFFLPGYYFFKLLFFIWLFYPHTDGAAIIYQKFIQPNLNKIISHKMHKN